MARTSARYYQDAFVRKFLALEQRIQLLLRSSSPEPAGNAVVLLDPEAPFSVAEALRPVVGTCRDLLQAANVAESKLTEKFLAGAVLSERHDEGQVGKRCLGAGSSASCSGRQR